MLFNCQQQSNKKKEDKKKPTGISKNGGIKKCKCLTAYIHVHTEDFYVRTSRNYFLF